MYHIPYCLAILDSTEFVRMLRLMCPTAKFDRPIIVVLLKVDYAAAR